MVDDSSPTGETDATMESVDGAYPPETTTVAVCLNLRMDAKTAAQTNADTNHDVSTEGNENTTDNPVVVNHPTLVWS